jgi:hypothetical protein
LERLLATHELAVACEVILWKGLGKFISYLVLSIDWEDLDEPLSHMFMKVRVTDIDMLGSRM